jgi:hypothetical protein
MFDTEQIHETLRGSTLCELTLSIDLTLSRVIRQPFRKPVRAARAIITLSLLLTLFNM